MSVALTEMLWQELARPLRRAKAKGIASGLPHWSDCDAGDVLAQAVDDHPDEIERWYALADYWVQKGNFIHAAAILDRAIARFPMAAGAYARRADALKSLNPDQSTRDLEQALALGASSPPPPLQVCIETPAASDSVATIYAELTDMMEYLTLNLSMSGIQRVVANMMRCAMDRTSANARDVIPIIPDYLNKVVYAADPSIVRELIDEVELRSPTRERVDRLLEAVRTSLRAIELEPGSILLIAGAFWIVKSYDLLKTLRQKGVVISVFVHDLIQIDNPEYVDEKATHAFRRSLVDVCEIASNFTTNSAFVARELRRFLAREMDLEIPVYPVPLATEMSLSPPERWAEESLRTEFGENGYALCVCTIEIRKNHIYVLQMWQEFLRAGRTNLPKLVFVGKWGWEVDHLQDLLERTRYLDGLVQIMNGVSDTALASLYRNCLFTIYPSFAEGWGLPIGESLVLGRPCIAAGVTSMPEVGGKLVRYIDPLDLETGIAAVAPLLDDPSQLSAWTNDIARDFKARTWAEFTEHLLGASRGLAIITQDIPKAFARIRPGELAVVGHDAVRQAGDAGGLMRTARMAREQGWFILEDSGSWSVSPLASVRFIASGCAPGDKVHVVVGLRGEPGYPTLTCQLRSDIQIAAFRDLEAATSLHGVDAIVAEDGTIEISILVHGEAPHFNGHKAYANLSALGYHRHGDADDIVGLMEAATFYP